MLRPVNPGLFVFRRFTGDDVERACYDPEDDDFLPEREPFVTNDQVLEANARL